MPKREVLISEHKHFALYSLQFKRFRWILKFDEKWSPNDHVKSSGFGAAVAKERFVYDFVKLLEAPVSYSFLERQNSTENQKSLHF